MDLDSSVTELKYISDKYSNKLKILNISTLKELITFFPRDYTDSTDISKISDIAFEDTYTIKAQVKNFSNISLKNKKSLQNLEVFDESGNLKVQFFNQPFLKQNLKVGDTYFFNGKSRIKGNKIIFYPSSFEIIKANQENIHIGRITPEYRLTSGVTKKWLRSRIKSLIDLIEEKKIKIPTDSILIKEDSLKECLKEIHFPSSKNSYKKAKEILSLLEMANVHLKIKKEVWRTKTKSFFPKNSYKSTEKFLKSLPFKLTNDQQKTITNILNALKNKQRVNYLIQGDVGSGKTVIAFLFAYIFAKEKKQVAILAPTTVLAKQHYDNAVKTFNNIEDIDIELITSENKNTRNSLLLIGTTAILNRKKELINDLALLIVDEQHRFGVIQRNELLETKNEYTHFINMTATPIPRTITELFFKDVSLSLIKTKPKGRKRIKSFLVPPEKREDSFDWISAKIEEGNQVYWVCPLIEENDAKFTKSVETVKNELNKKIPGVSTKILHGKMKPKEKQDVMKQFKNNEFSVLVSTTVIEVGVDIPNATIMVIENGERFGLAQLHQIRGRVGRSHKQSYCFVFTDPEINPEAKERLEFFVKTADGLKIAEFDLKNRGPGEVYGNKQSGIPDLKIANLMDLKLIKKASNLAKKAYNSDIKSIYLFS